MPGIPHTRPSLLARLGDRRDEAAWQEFVDLYVPVIYTYARRQGLQDADAFDLSQEVISAVMGAISRLKYDPERGTFRGWLFTIVRRKLANWRRTQKHPTACGEGQPEQILEECPAPQGNEREWEAEWERQLFAWACEKVRPQVARTSWLAFWRTAIDDQPGKQVAADLGMSVAAVYLARSRIVRRIKELVQSVQEP
jgi:RNA polymerase sigma-70 factor (ECF subfamily)